MELRDIEIFLTVAEELHFGRAAERLHVSQPRISQAISQQERRLGGELFDRSNRRQVHLTPLGRQLRDDLQLVYADLNTSLERARLIARGISGVLTLGSMGPQGLLIQGILDRFRTQHPDVQLVHREINTVDPLTPLRKGELDVALLWLPVGEPDITIGPVTHTSSVVLAMSASHPYADRASVTLEDFGDLTFIAHRSAISAPMEETFHPFHTPSGRPIARGPIVSDWEDELKTIGDGTAVAAAAGEAPRYYPRPNVAYVPVRDAPPIQWAFAWRANDTNPLIHALAAAVDPATGNTQSTD
ncbi:LysR substrate-binding domain-containing protein [Actinomadura luteofluorescens]|uniref:DNA-binding transcriptional LysR family regulator n=1 Tax=Actinomadura luteofluorescens TaxID=46163 RepID=A0A7Y9EMQ3_9ACTN|nr:LysR family transcriptional regulator [Actinomadura luteofluorescens]NYD50491.1 DNA-binding transcriptional LysR family regulator [Actinomadura luteofluorescens]